MVGAPARVPGSIRRTSTIDSLRPDGVAGEVIVRGAARDLVTFDDGSCAEVGMANVGSRIDYLGGYRVLELTSDPALSDPSLFVGRAASAGFRSVVASALPGERERATLLHLLLDDLPGAVLVSGYVGVRARMPVKREGNFALQILDLCAGFTRDGTILTETDHTGMPPAAVGPVAPSLDRSDDPDAWHPIEALAQHGVRRLRRLDVVPGEMVTISAYFRDSHMSDEGDETVIHEYSLDAELDPVSRCFTSSAARAQVLPWQECIDAETSARRLVGRSADGLRGEVRQSFVGPSTCTHLNDTLRSLEDVPVLAEMARQHCASRHEDV